MRCIRVKSSASNMTKPGNSGDTAALAVPEVVSNMTTSGTWRDRQFRTGAAIYYQLFHVMPLLFQRASLWPLHDSSQSFFFDSENGMRSATVSL